MMIVQGSDGNPEYVPASRNGGKPCANCGQTVPKGRVKYCSHDCAAVMNVEVKRKSAFEGKCSGCGEPRDRKGRGVKLCSSCLAMSKDTFAAYEADRNKRRVREAQKTRLESTNGARRMPPTDDKKWCARCQEYRPFTQFTKQKNRYSAYCKPCQRSYNRERRLDVIYGISQNDFDALWEAQEGKCAICSGHPRKKMLSVDHDHKTGEIRGLLCSRCNHKLLGSANDDPARLRKAADYLESGFATRVLGEPRYHRADRKRSGEGT